ncbi:RNA polymerase, sigma subunit, SigW [Alteribacillus persepolensis]|uniref:RNA polymerase sigma factor SigW n=1 Tax=Alteribacillus persepolensis TaxID=568899 RepID=A0A1G8JHV5_9BACI|nr:RNA polymerase sigma factor SigW [Alteribacillus persepolensis]SDI30671.1 RNA polymerase, sigma subunit, SigW [Alteribacillus persepolensis]
MDAVVKRLIKEIKKDGDEKAFAELVDLYKDKVFQIAYRMTGNHYEAQDMAQESFLRAYANIDRYDENRKFSTWLFRITTNLCIDRLRKRKPDYSLDEEIKGTDGLTGYAQIAATDQLPEDQVVTLEMQEWVQKAIVSLPPKYRSAIILRYIEDLNIQQISNILDLPENTVKTHIHRGREALRKRLKDA